MSIRGEDRNREEAELFFQYLRESDRYKELCSLMERGTRLDKLPKKFQPASGPIQSLNPIILTYTRFGNIHKINFETWYKEKINAQNWPGFKKASVTNALSKIESDIDCCMTIFLDREGREATGKELKAELLSWIRNKGPFEEYVHVYRNRFTSEETEILGDSFHELMTQKQSTASRARFLKIYLYVYQQMKKGIKVKNIDFDHFEVDQIRSEDQIYRWNRWAKRIIENAERSVFPGKYKD